MSRNLFTQPFYNYDSEDENLTPQEDLLLTISQTKTDSKQKAQYKTLPKLTLPPDFHTRPSTAEPDLIDYSIKDALHE